VDIASHVIARLQRDSTLLGDVHIDFFRTVRGEAPSIENLEAVWIFEGAVITRDDYGGGSGRGITECITLSVTNINKVYAPTRDEARLANP
jgi:hypothetical protein